MGSGNDPAPRVTLLGVGAGLGAVKVRLAGGTGLGSGFFFAVTLDGRR